MAIPYLKQPKVGKLLRRPQGATLAEVRRVVPTATADDLNNMDTTRHGNKWFQIDRSNQHGHRGCPAG
jgi:hypothetical protein